MKDMEEGQKDLLIDQMEQHQRQLMDKNSELSAAISMSNFGNAKEGNVIQYQLESDDILDKIEHFFRGDIIKTNEDGDTYYAPQTNSDLQLLNEYGVNSMMHKLQNYVNRNTNLSYYSEDRINEILSDVGDALNKLLFCNYEKMGLDTEFKRTKYEEIVVQTLHIIESAYRRAIGGKERELINNNNININQTERIGQYPLSQSNLQTKNKFNLFNPKTW